MTKIWAGIAVLIIAIIGGAWLVMTPGTQGGAEAAPDEKLAFAWNITELAEDPAMPGTPRASVSLTVGDKTYDAGEFNGSCAEIDGTSWTLAEGEKTGVICWWAGGGDEIGVFDEGGALVLKVGVLDEGSAEVASFRGDYRTIATIEE